jgi:hypothetical protein
MAEAYTGKHTGHRAARTRLKALPDRLAKFHLELVTEKSSLVKFNRWEPDTSGRFTFLGFDFYWARTRRNPKYAVVKLRTTSKKPSAFLETASTAYRLTLLSIALALPTTPA